ncbi:MAG: DUF5119 domain-containing protein [Tannerellaceae bacterium]
MKQFISLVLIVIAGSFAACQRQTLVDQCVHKTALIPVQVDWIRSGINPTKGEGDDFVHRVSFRFFPKNGSKPFELYLEGNVHQGYIEIPTGSYDILIMNESVHDIYWLNMVRFRNIDAFESISAEVYPDNPAAYDFYTPTQNEQFMLDLPKMASWSIRNYEVTEEVVVETRAPIELQTKDYTMYVPMQRLTHDCRVIATVKNLKSAQLIRGAKRGFANKVFLASRVTYNSPATFFLTFNGRKPIGDSKTDGTTEKTFRTFGALPMLFDYSLGVDVVLVDGRRYYPDDPFDLEFQVAQHVYSYFTKPGISTRVLPDKVEIPINLILPEVSGGVDVGDWGDDDNITIE